MNHFRIVIAICVGLVLTASTVSASVDNQIDFPTQVTLPDGRTATRLSEADVPSGNWRLTTYVLYGPQGRRSKSGNATMTFPKTTPAVWTLTPYFSNPGGPRAWYQTSSGCLTQYRATVPGPENTEGKPEQYNWMALHLVNRVCSWTRLRNRLVVYLSTDPYFGPAKITESMTFLKVQ
jgi:hypothetical protein